MFRRELESIHSMSKLVESGLVEFDVMKPMVFVSGDVGVMFFDKANYLVERKLIGFMSQARLYLNYLRSYYNGARELEGKDRLPMLTEEDRIQVMIGGESERVKVVVNAYVKGTHLYII